MTRIEIEIDERVPGKIEVSCRSYNSAWKDPTPDEQGIVNEIMRELRPMCANVGRSFGTVEALEGSTVERLRREGRI